MCCPASGQVGWDLRILLIRVYELFIFTEGVPYIRLWKNGMPLR